MYWAHGYVLIFAVVHNDPLLFINGFWWVIYPNLFPFVQSTFWSILSKSSAQAFSTYVGRRLATNLVKRVLNYS